MGSALSVLIPARNEIFLRRTIEDILANVRGDTEIIAVCDGNWPDPPIEDHERVHLIYHSESIGQRAAVNEAARMSEAEFIMKCDAHCAFGESFDVKLIEPYQSGELARDVTSVPRMYNLHAFDWQCGKCKLRTYQGPTPTGCERCDNTTDFERVIVWQSKPSPETDFMRFGSDLVFKYWSGYKKRPEAKGDICDLMSCLGACWLMPRERFWELGGLDEKHGSWGQMGTEIACKSWLSGGRMVVNKKTWFAHLFRTQGGDFGFPYKIHGSDQGKAREYSRDLWLNDKWPKAVRPLSWLIDKFAPVPGWSKEEPTKGIIFYTDHRLRLEIAHAVQKRLRTIAAERSIQVVTTSLKPMSFGDVHACLAGLQPGYLTMFKQILAGLEASAADIIFLCEHDVLYHPSHFDFVPPRKDVFYYNTNVWKLRAEDGHALRVNDCKQTSGLCAYRSLLFEHYRKRVEVVERDGFSRRMGFEPGTHRREERIDDHIAEGWESEYPNIDIRHNGNLTPSRWERGQFRNKQYTEGWAEKEADDAIVGWGRIRDILKIMA